MAAVALGSRNPDSNPSGSPWPDLFGPGKRIRMVFPAGDGLFFSRPPRRWRGFANVIGWRPWRNSGSSGATNRPPVRSERQTEYDKLAPVDGNRQTLRPIPLMPGQLSGASLVEALNRYVRVLFINFLNQSFYRTDGVQRSTFIATSLCEHICLSSGFGIYFYLWSGSCVSLNR